MKAKLKLIIHAVITAIGDKLITAGAILWWVTIATTLLCGFVFPILGVYYLLTLISRG